jgi:Ca2+-binding RTX toxin-like protein
MDNAKRRLALFLSMGVVVSATPTWSQETTTYSYDPLGRLIGVSINGGPGSGVTKATCFDAAGNRSVYSVGGPGTNCNTATSLSTAVADTATAVDNVSTSINVLANDSAGAAIASVNGTGLTVGQSTTLASGATATLNADSTISYNSNHAFGTLAGVTGATNSTATDTFSYALVGGSSATVTVTVNGNPTSTAHALGSAGNDNMTGTSGDDYFDLSQGGNDTAAGGAGNDAFFMGAAMTAADHIDGGTGTNDQVALQGNYTGANKLVLGASTITNVEALTFLPGYSYDVTSNDGNVAAGQTLTIYGSTLGASDNLTFNGSAETDGKFFMYGGLGADNLTGGAGADAFYFGRGGKFNPATDHVDGGPGSDQMALVGSYTVTISNASVTNVEVLSLLDDTPSPTYNITLADDWTPAGQTRTVYGVAVHNGFTVDASAESDGNLVVYGGLGDDTITTGAGNDIIWGKAGADVLKGGAGADTYAYNTVSDSIGSAHDIIIGFDPSVDKIDLPSGISVTGIDAAISSGAASSATFDSDLTTALASLGSHHAVQFTPSSGTLAGHTLEVIDTNGVAGYQAGQDMVIELQSPVSSITAVTIFI